MDSHTLSMATVVQKFGTKLRKLRKSKGFTQVKLAEKAKIDFSYLNLIEGGKRNPTLKVIAKIARALGARLEELLKLK